MLLEEDMFSEFELVCESCNFFRCNFRDVKVTSYGEPIYECPVCGHIPLHDRQKKLFCIANSLGSYLGKDWGKDIWIANLEELDDPHAGNEKHLCLFWGSEADKVIEQLTNEKDFNKFEKRKCCPLHERPLIFNNNSWQCSVKKCEYKENKK